MAVAETEFDHLIGWMTVTKNNTFKIRIVLGNFNFQCRGVLLISTIVGQRPTVHAVGAGRGCLAFISVAYLIFSFSVCLEDGPI